MSIMSMKMMTNMAHLQHHLRKCYIKPILKVWWTKMKSLSSYHVNELIWLLLCPKRAWRCWPIWLICNTLRDNAMLKLSCKFGELKWNPCWLIMLTTSSGTNYVVNEHENVNQYGSLAIPSEIMLYQSHHESLVNQNEILIELSC